MMMNSSCIAGCLDVEAPVEKRFMRMYLWAQADKEFLRMLSMYKDGGESVSSSCPTPTPSPARAPTSCDHRQRYLRSYTFSRKQTTAERTKKWLNQKKINSKVHNPARRSCSLVDVVFKFLFVCVAKVDVHEM
ncbi:hypothetical protein NMG60_11008043 [Bertholletia excelsa]